jgi:hypothetical protein
LKTVGSILALIMLLSVFFGVYQFMEKHYALATEMQKIEKRLDYKIADDQRFLTDQEMRQIEERNLGKPIEKWDQRDRLRYKELQKQLDKTQNKMKEMQ